MNGKMVLQQKLSNVNVLNVNDLPKGIFTARIVADGKIATRKFVVE
jgi:hypothetical protein